MSDQSAHSDQSAQPTHPTQPVKPPVTDEDPLLTAPTTPVTNETIRTQLAHRTIRAFTDEPVGEDIMDCLLYTSPSPRDRTRSRMPSSA